MYSWIFIGCFIQGVLQVKWPKESEDDDWLRESKGVMGPSPALEINVRG